MIIRKICSVMLCILAAALLMNSVALAEDSVEEPSTFVEIDVEDFGKTKVKVYEGFDFINHNSVERDWKLALNAAVLSKTVYDKYAADVYEKLGYDIIYEQSDIEPQLDKPTMAFAYKMVIDGNGRKKNVFSVVVKGSSTLRDFDTDFLDGAYNMFGASANYATKLLKDFMVECTGQSIEELEKEDNYFFFTGHSLGGAVANILSIKDEVLRLAGNDKGKIYTYTFEPPHTCIALFWMNVGEMSNAFNFKDVDDPVTNLPPYLWSTTYGTDVPFSTNDLSAEVFKALFPNAKRTVLSLTIEINSLRQYNTVKSHHNLIGDFVYILQAGNLIDDDYIEVNVNLNEISTTSVLSEIVSFIRDNDTGTWAIHSKEIYEYDDQGRLVERRKCSSTGDIWDREILEYDDNGNMVKKSQTMGYMSNTHRDSYHYCITSYDSEGRVINVEYYVENRTSHEYEISYSYDVTYEENMEKTTSYYWHHNSDEDYWYRGDAQGVTYAEKDQNGKVLRSTFYYGDVTKYLTEYEYDNMGNRIAERRYVRTSLDEPDNGRLLSEELFKYDDSGELIWWSTYQEGESLQEYENVINYENGYKHVTTRSVGAGNNLIIDEDFVKEEFAEDGEHILKYEYIDDFGEYRSEFITKEYSYRINSYTDEISEIEKIVTHSVSFGRITDTADYYIYKTNY